VGGEKPHIGLHADLDALRGIAGGLHETENGEIVDINTIRMIGCDCSITRIVLGPDSEILDVGRKTNGRRHNAGRSWPVTGIAGERAVEPGQGTATSTTRLTGQTVARRRSTTECSSADPVTPSNTPRTDTAVDCERELRGGLRPPRKTDVNKPIPHPRSCTTKTSQPFS
jgi:hypothetical protein